MERVKNQPPRNKDFHCLEFSVSMNCVNTCWYCPQKLIMSKYKGPQFMTLKEFKKALENVPKNVRLRFAGYAEPFMNPEFSDMLVYANEQGYKIAVYTTFVCFKKSDHEKIKDIPFEFFHVHNIEDLPNSLQTKERAGFYLPDLPYVDEWKQAEPNNRANNLEEKNLPTMEPKTSGYDNCGHTEGYHLNTVLPTGDVVICCQDWGLTTIIGNIFETPYYELNREWDKELCRTCVYSS